jgi:hypothetical protein
MAGAFLTGNAADVNDLTLASMCLRSKAAGLDPIATNGLAGKKKTLQIKIEHRVPIRFRNLCRRTAPVAARNVREDIDLSHPCEDILHKHSNLHDPRDIRWKRLRTYSASAEFFSNRKKIRFGAAN